MDMIIENPWITPELRTKQSYQNDSYLKGLVEKVATLELRENKHAKEESLRQLREWIRQNPDIENCITDDSFLLRFLRAKKYSLIMAQQTLLKYLNLRRTFPRVFFNMDYRDPNVNEIISNGYIFASPFRDSKGRRVIITTGRLFDPQKYSSVDMAKAHIITYETVLDNEIDQVLGVVHVGDAKDCGSAYITLWNISEFITLIRWGEQSFPMRHKEIHLLHIPHVLKYVYDFCVGIVSNKMKNRVAIYDSESDLHNKIDYKLLPKEYGGVMPMSEMIKQWKQELEAKRERLLSYDSIKLLSDRGIIRRRHKNVPVTDEVGGVPGSFRKLELD